MLSWQEAVCQAFLAFDTDSSGFLDNQQLGVAWHELKTGPLHPFELVRAYFLCHLKRLSRT